MNQRKFERHCNRIVKSLDKLNKKVDENELSSQQLEKLGILANGWKTITAAMESKLPNGSK